MENKGLEMIIHYAGAGIVSIAVTNTFFNLTEVQSILAASMFGILVVALIHGRS